MADCNLILYTQSLAYCNSNVENGVFPASWVVCIPLILQGNKHGNECSRLPPVLGTPQFSTVLHFVL